MVILEEGEDVIYCKKWRDEDRAVTRTVSGVLARTAPSVGSTRGDRESHPRTRQAGCIPRSMLSEFPSAATYSYSSSLSSFSARRGSSVVVVTSLPRIFVGLQYSGYLPSFLSSVILMDNLPSQPILVECLAT
jgi:hypothetical protein